MGKIEKPGDKKRTGKKKTDKEASPTSEKRKYLAPVITTLLTPGIIEVAEASECGYIFFSP
jgi:hypothetical protein